MARSPAHAIAAAPPPNQHAASMPSAGVSRNIVKAM